MSALARPAGLGPRALPALLGLLLLAGAARAEPALVILVRHAEKAVEPRADPALSEAGERRAQQLAAALQEAGVQHVLVSKWRRTQDTAAPLARRLGLKPQVVEAPSGVSHAQALRERLATLQGNVLVVGHSNTLAPLLALLGGPALPDLCETSHGQAFVLQGASPPRLLRLRYGEPDPPPAEGCL